VPRAGDADAVPDLLLMLAAGESRYAVKDCVLIATANITATM